MVDLFQDVNRVFSFSRCLNKKFHWRNCIVTDINYLVTQIRRVNKYKSSPLSYLTKALKEHFSWKLRHLLNVKPVFMSWQRSTLNEVNNWAPKIFSRIASHLAIFLDTLGKSENYIIVIWMILYTQKIPSNQLQFIIR